MGVRTFAGSLARTRRPERAAARDALVAQRTSLLSSAARQFQSPTLSGQQSGLLSGISSLSGIQGVFGGAVGGAVDRSRTQFLAGNRLAGIEGLLGDFLNFAPQGVAGATNVPFLEREREAVLGQIAGLRNQFAFGGQAGREFVEGLDPGQVGGFLGRRQRRTLALPRRGLLGNRAGQISQPGTPENELARRFAELQGATDQAGFISENPQLGRAVRRAGLQGLDATQATIGQDLFGARGGPQIVQDQLGPGIVSDSLEGPAGAPRDIQMEIFSQIAQQVNTPRFGIRAQAAGAGLEGLSASGILPFFARQGLGGATDTFAPLLFGR